MRLNYDKDTDSLYIHLSERAGAEAHEAAEGVVLDFDASGTLVGIDIQHASRITDLSRFVVEYVPTVAA